MFLHEMKKNDGSSIKECFKHSRTLDFKRKRDNALRQIEIFLRKVKNPAISCGGGKDGTAISILARSICPSIPIICGDAPNTLSDRDQHLESLFSWLGGTVHRVPYDWDVEPVLRGVKAYPEGLKMRILSKWQKMHGIDGIIFGVRASESKLRRISLSSRGFVYEMKEGWRCQPIADMSAAESICVAIMSDAPINPVYTRHEGYIDFDSIRDGTWWPHGKIDRSSWIRRYYPEHYEDFKKASIVYDASKSRVCVF